MCKQHPYKMWRVKGNLIKPIFNNKNKTPWHNIQYAELPKIYEQNASLEIAWTRVLKKKIPTISGKRVIPFFSKNFEGFDINLPEDFEFLEYLVKNKKVKLKKL